MTKLVEEPAYSAFARLARGLLLVEELLAIAQSITEGLRLSLYTDYREERKGTARED